MAISRKEYTPTALSVELKKDIRTIGVLLEGLEPCRTGKAAKYYYLDEVFEHFFARQLVDRLGRKEDGEIYDRQQEEARLKHHQANNEALKEAELTSKLMRTEIVVELCSAGVANCRNRLLAVDKKLRTEFAGLSDEVFERIYELHCDALSQLGEGGIPRGLEERISKYMEQL